MVSTEFQMARLGVEVVGRGVGDINPMVFQVVLTELKQIHHVQWF